MLETTLERIATALEKIADSFDSAAVIAPTAADQPVPNLTPAPADPIPPAAPVPAAAAPEIPTAPAEPALPFNDKQGMINYVMAAYQELGPEKGAQIQAVLVNLGHPNINDVPPEQFQAVFDGVEKLKVA